MSMHMSLDAGGVSVMDGQREEMLIRPAMTGGDSEIRQQHQYHDRHNLINNNNSDHTNNINSSNNNNINNINLTTISTNSSTESSNISMNDNIVEHRMTDVERRLSMFETMFHALSGKLDQHFKRYDMIINSQQQQINELNSVISVLLNDQVRHAEIVRDKLSNSFHGVSAQASIISGMPLNLLSDPDNNNNSNNINIVHSHNDSQRTINTDIVNSNKINDDNIQPHHDSTDSNSNNSLFNQTGADNLFEDILTGNEKPNDQRRLLNIQLQPQSIAEQTSINHNNDNNNKINNTNIHKQQNNNKKNPHHHHNHSNINIQKPTFIRERFETNGKLTKNTEMVSFTDNELVDYPVNNNNRKNYSDNDTGLQDNDSSNSSVNQLSNINNNLGTDFDDNPNINSNNSISNWNKSKHNNNSLVTSPKLGIDNYTSSSTTNTTNINNNNTNRLLPKHVRDFKFIKSPHSVKEIWLEYTEGYKGQPSLKQMESMYQSAWRREPAVTKRFSRRRILGKAIENGLAKGYELQHIIDLLENHRIVDQEKGVKQPIGWLCQSNHIPSILK